MNWILAAGFVIIMLQLLALLYRLRAIHDTLKRMPHDFLHTPIMASPKLKIPERDDWMSASEE
jgi:hypothetical protein